MQRLWWRWGCGCAALAVVLSWNLRPVYAVKEFRDEFVRKYVKADANSLWKTKVSEAKCSICHIADQPKENRNEYGQALARLVKKTDKKDRHKIAAALEKVAARKARAADPKAPTFGELIKQGKLPASGQ